MAYSTPMNHVVNSRDIINCSLAEATAHYENFPVASKLLPKALRAPIALIYSFARQADDFADEGNLLPEQRLDLLDGFRDELYLIQAYIKPKSPFFTALAQTIREHQLNLTPFFDLLDAFRQDVIKTRYVNFDEVLDYCKRSANPVGRLLLQLFKQATPSNVALSDHVCTALQLINFLQDIAIDAQKNEGKQRIYLCQDEMRQFKINESDVVKGKNNENWQAFMAFNISRASNLLQIGKPLGRILTGRIGLEIRAIIAGGERILCKLKKTQGNVFNQRPTLNKWDWLLILIKAMLKI